MPSCSFLHRLPLLFTSLLIVYSFTPFTRAAEPAIQAKATFTDSSAAGLAGTKRVAISSVLVTFQASVGDQTSTNGLLANKSDTSSSLEMPFMDAALLTAITDEIYAQLKTDLAANGFEVLPEATVVASPTYQKIIKVAGITNFSKFANREGDVMLVGPAGLKPYYPYLMETTFINPDKSLIAGWITKGKASTTPGGPTVTSVQSTYALPGLEVQLAKELNAHVVKASYLVTIGSTKAGIAGRFSNVNTHTGKAFAQVGLRGEQTRIAFRTPNGKTGGQKADRGKHGAAKDGDVVLTLAESLQGGTGFFNVTGTEHGKGLIGRGADEQFTFTVTITDPAAYKAETLGMLKTAQRDLLALVKQ